MSYTKLEIAQRLQSLLYPDTTVDAKLSVQEAMEAISEARDAYVKFNLLQMKGETNIVMGNWLSEFHDVEVKYDANRNRYYSNLPVGVISLPNDMGVYHVYFPDAEADLFIPVTPAMRAMYKHSLAKSLEGDYGYYLLEDRIWYTQKMPDNCTVSMNLVAQSADLGEYDYFPIDGSAVSEILQRAAQLLLPQREIPQDIRNNGISD